MALTYDSKKDIFAFVSAGMRSFSAARNATLVTPSDTVDLPVYGRLRVYNAGAGVESATLLPVGATDDANTVTFKFPVGLTIMDEMLVRRVMSTSLGADLTIHVLG